MPLVTPRPRILFYAINGIGLGHVVRLATVARVLTGRATLACYSNSPAAQDYWPGQVFRVDDDPSLEPEVRGARILQGFYSSLARFDPQVIVCDTHWPRPIIRNLRNRGVRTVLVLRALSVEDMKKAAHAARQDFSTILLPHHPAELLALYGADPNLIEILATAPFATIGPIARTSSRRTSSAQFLITVGGGGEYHRHDPANSVEGYLQACAIAAATLRNESGLVPFLAAGPLIDSRHHQSLGIELIQSSSLHEHFGPASIVVTRGGYNTCWEALAAGAKLLIVGSHRGAEDIPARARFLQASGLARHSASKASEIVAAARELLTSYDAEISPLANSVNAGLRLAADEVLGSTHLRDRSADSFYGLREALKSNVAEISLANFRALNIRIARFDDVSLASPDDKFLRLARLAIGLGYRVQAHVTADDGHPSRAGLELLCDGVELWCHGSIHVRGHIETADSIRAAARKLSEHTGHQVKGVSYPYDQEGPSLDVLRPSGLRLSTLTPRTNRDVDHEICVDLCSWPGPRWRSEIAVCSAILTHRLDGLCFHGDRSPLVPQEMMLNLFAPRRTLQGTQGAGLS